MRGQLATLLVASACATSGTSPVTIHGHGTPCTGPLPPPSGYVLQVTLERDGTLVDTRAAEGPGYTFSFSVAPGTYQLSAPGDRPVEVVAKPGRTHEVVLPPACL